MLYESQIGCDSGRSEKKIKNSPPAAGPSAISGSGEMSAYPARPAPPRVSRDSCLPANSVRVRGNCWRHRNARASCEAGRAAGRTVNASEFFDDFRAPASCGLKLRMLQSQIRVSESLQLRGLGQPVGAGCHRAISGTYVSSGRRWAAGALNVQYRGVSASGEIGRRASLRGWW